MQIIAQASHFLKTIDQISRIVVYMNSKLDEGIVLHSVNYRDYDRLLTIFTKEGGILSCYARGANRKKNPLQTLCTPLARIEMVYKPSRGDLYNLQEGRVLNSHLRLRKSWDSLNAACEMAQALRKSQYPGKPAPQLYTLLCIYLESIAEIPAHKELSASFFLKLLRHDGLLSLKSSCNFCAKDLKEQGAHLHKGESLCYHHALPHAHFLNKEELHTFQILTYSRSIEKIAELSLSQEDFNKAQGILKTTLRA